VRCVCGRHFTARTGTAAQGMTANWRQLTVLTILAFRGCRIDVIAAACDLSDNTIRQYLKRLRA
jgi:transposase-like protein